MSMPVVKIRAMSRVDIADGMRLKAEAGWNQLEADLLRFFDLAVGGCFVAVKREEVVGTVTTCRFGPIGWVAMMLVGIEHRGQGIGRILMQTAIDWLKGHEVKSIRLDATPIGQPLYESLGFQVDFSLRRFAGHPQGCRSFEEVRVATEQDRAMILSLDHQATRTNRSILFDRVFAEYPDQLITTSHAFATWRPGRNATQVGPCISDKAYGALIRDTLIGESKLYLIIGDIDKSRVNANLWAESRGPTPARQLTRMTLEQKVYENRDRLWISSGPEMG